MIINLFSCFKNIKNDNKSYIINNDGGGMHMSCQLTVSVYRERIMINGIERYFAVL